MTLELHKNAFGELLLPDLSVCYIYGTLKGGQKPAYPGEAFNVLNVLSQNFQTTGYLKTLKTETPKSSRQ